MASVPIDLRRIWEGSFGVTFEETMHACTACQIVCLLAESVRLSSIGEVGHANENRYNVVKLSTQCFAIIQLLIALLQKSTVLCI